MANEQNLRPSEYKLSREEAKKGGIKSGESRRRKRMLSELIDIFGEKKVKSEKTLQMLREMGLNADEMTNDMAMIVGQYVQAMRGNPASAGWIRDTNGQKPVDRTEIEMLKPPMPLPIDKSEVVDGQENAES